MHRAFNWYERYVWTQSRSMATNVSYIICLRICYICCNNKNTSGNHMAFIIIFPYMLYVFHNSYASVLVYAHRLPTLLSLQMANSKGITTSRKMCQLA